MKEKKFLRIVIVLLMLVLVMSISDADANAATLHSQNEAVNWAVARANEKWQQDVDGVYGCQCVDLIMAYYQYLVGYHVSGNAKDYGSNSLPSGWVRVKDNPQPGDIVVWGAGAQMGWSPLETAYANSVYGHIGIIWKVNANGSVSTVETNTHLSVAAASYNRYINNSICLIRPDFNKTGYDPQGSFDSAIGQVGTIRVGGWAVDQDALTSPVVVHVYVDGQFACAITANGYRPDINAAIPGAGNYHGFDGTFAASPGTHKVEVYAINIGSQSNPLLGSKTVTVSADTEKPKVSNIRIENITEDGYVVKCTVTDNMGIKKVLFPTYPDTNGDWNAIWHEGMVSGTTATCVIKTKDHADLVNTYYQTHIYAYDYSDNTGFGATEKYILNVIIL